MGVVNQRKRAFALVDDNDSDEDGFDLGDFFYLQQYALVSDSDDESESESDSESEDTLDLEAIWNSWRHKLDVIRDRWLDLEEMRTWFKESHHPDSEGNYIVNKKFEVTPKISKLFYTIMNVSCRGDTRP